MDRNFTSYSSYHSSYVERKDFNTVAQNVGSNIEKISQNVSSMKKMVNHIGTSQDSQDLRQKLHQIQHYTNNLAKDTSASFKELASIPLPPSPSQQREHKMQKERLSEELTAALNAFQDIQRRTFMKEKEEVQRNRTNSGLQPPPSKLNERFDTHLIELQESSSTVALQAQLQDEMNFQLMEEQEQAILQLERDINEVNNIFKELGALVHEQGEVIDSIEANVEKTDVLVNEGAIQLRQASTLQNKLRKRKAIVFLVLAVILIFLIIVISWHS